MKYFISTIRDSGKWYCCNHTSWLSKTPDTWDSCWTQNIEKKDVMTYKMCRFYLFKMRNGWFDKNNLPIIEVWE